MQNQVKLTIEDAQGKICLVGRHEKQEFVIDGISVLSGDDNPVVGEDALNEGYGDLISHTARILAAMLSDMPTHVLPDVVKSTTEAFTEAANIGGGDDPAYAFNGLTNLYPNAFGEILLQIIGDMGDPDTEKLSDKGVLNAKRVADVIGPDWAQLLYRFAVLTTKLA